MVLVGKGVPFDGYRLNFRIFDGWRLNIWITPLFKFWLSRCIEHSDVFDHISKHPESLQNYFAARRIFNSFLNVWKCDQTLSLVFTVHMT